MKALSHWMLMVWILLAHIAAPAPASAQNETAAPETSLAPLSSLLQADGTLNLHTGFRGNLDPRGWQMVSQPGQPPRFVRAGSPAEGMQADAPGNEFWDNRFNVLGVSGYVNALAVSGEDVYVGGRFSAVGGVPANNVARWNSASGTWSAMGEGVSGYVYAIAASGDNVYVGGLFSAAGAVTADNIATWNRTTGVWSAMSGGVSSYVYAIAASGDNVYVGGLFNAAGGYPSVNDTFNIARWNRMTRTWSAMGQGIAGYVYAIAVSGSDVYVGGLFNSVVGYPSVPNTYNIARWNGSSWSALGEGVSGYVYAIAVSGDDVYVGGIFPSVTGYPSVPNTTNIARWNRASRTWSALGQGVAGYVYAIAVSGSDVYVGGLFNSVGGYPSVPNTFNIAKWNGGSWSALGSGVSSYVYSIAIGADGVYVGGLFNAAGDKASRNIGRWSGNQTNPPLPPPPNSNWDDRFGPTGLSPNQIIYAVAIDGTNLYVGGSFTMVGDVSAKGVARWNGSSWSALGDGVVGNVFAIAVKGSNVYVGGDITKAGDVSVGHIARWNGSQWSAMDGGVYGVGVPVIAIAVSGSYVYVGGWITLAGDPSAGTDVAVNNIARWNGSSWSAMGSGVNGIVDTIAVSGSNVYVGGQFTKAGEVDANYIAKWNGSRWSALGSGVSGGAVIDIAVSGSDVYAGGTFTTAGGKSANYIAKWNGSSWSALGSGIGPGSVHAIAISGSEVYAGGSFNSAGGMTVNNIARWNGSAWSPLGSGITPSMFAYALATNGADVFVGGYFESAGGKPSENFAIWHTGYPPAPGGSLSGSVTGSGGGSLASALVQACPAAGGACLWSGYTDSGGVYAAGELPAGNYTVKVFPPAASSLRPNATAPVSLPEFGSQDGLDISLRDYRLVPSGVSLTPLQAGSKAVARLAWNRATTLSAQGCSGGSGSYQITQAGAVQRSGAMMETQAGRYSATIDSLAPYSGDAEAQVTIRCSGSLAPAADTVYEFDLYIQPAFTVRTFSGQPIAGATVTLLAYDANSGSFLPVPNGDATMAPLNRANPDTTDALGGFGWDLSEGIYKIRAEKTGCAAPGLPEQPNAESGVLVVPQHDATDLSLYLDCGMNNFRLYLPLAQN